MKKTWQGSKQIINMNNKLGPQITHSPLAKIDIKMLY